MKCIKCKKTIDRKKEGKIYGFIVLENEHINCAKKRYK